MSKMYLNKHLHTYYLIVLIIVIIGSGLSLWCFGNNQFLKHVSVAEIFQSDLKIRDIIKQEYPENIQVLINEGRMRSALLLLERFEEEATEINKVTLLNGYISLKGQVKILKNHLRKFINYPDLRNLISVLNEKINVFKGFVEMNGWKTLIRISKSMKLRLRAEQIRKDYNFSVLNLSTLHGFLVKKQRKIKDVTLSSILTSQKQSQILAHSRSFSGELKMLKDYISTLVKFNKGFSDFNMVYAKWVSAVKPEITLQKIELENNNKYLLYFLLAMIIFSFISMLMGICVYKKNRINIEKEINFKIFDVIENGLVSEKLRPITFDKYGEDINNEVKKYRDYFHKRMNFGIIFQEAIPFGSILFDSNLNSIWANSIFYELFDLDNSYGKGNTLNWETLQRFTNLGENDPLLSAINHGVAGIYQIQVRKKGTSQSAPFEMYVSPISNGNQSRVMIFFYPLRGLEDTINNQIQSIVGPIGRMFDLLNANILSGEEREKIEKDFDIAGIRSLYKKIKMYNESIDNQKDRLLNEIGELEHKIKDQHQILQEFVRMSSDIAKINENIIENFKGVKEIIIGNLEHRYTIENHIVSAVKILDENGVKYQEVLEYARTSGEIIKESLIICENLNVFRDEFKMFKDKIFSLKAQLVLSATKILSYIDKEQESANTYLENMLESFKSDVKRFQSGISSFNHISKKLDMAMSKMALILEGDNISFMEKISNKSSYSDQNTINLKREVVKVTNMGEDIDEILITSLKEMYRNIKDFKELSYTVNKLSSGMLICEEHVIEKTNEPKLFV